MKAQDYDAENFLIEEVERDRQRRSAFALLLEQQRQQAGHIFALKAKMGITDSYIAHMPLSWVDNNVFFAEDLPLFEEKSDVKKIAANKDSTSICGWVDWRRQLSMSTYLAERENYKIPPLSVVAYQNWAYKTPLESDNWGPDSRAIKPSLYAMSLDINGHFFNVIDEDTRYYMLDGQHRLLAIRGLKQLLEYGQLSACDKDGKRKKKGAIHLKDIIASVVERRKSSGDNRTSESEVREQLQRRFSDTIGVEIIPAVQQGETQEEATARLRQTVADLQINNRC